MKELKIRARVNHYLEAYVHPEVTNGMWVKGDLHLQSNTPHIHTDCCHKYKIDTDTIGRPTEQTDENGVEIYEGDILSWRDDLFPDTVFHGRVFYRDAAFYVQTEQWYLGSFCSDSSDEMLLMDVVGLDNLVVIGNIYDDPEEFQSPMEGEE